MVKKKGKGCTQIPPELVGAIADAFLPYVNRNDRGGCLARYQELLVLFDQDPSSLIKGLRVFYESTQALSRDRRRVSKPPQAA